MNGSFFTLVDTFLSKTIFYHDLTVRMHCLSYKLNNQESEREHSYITLFKPTKQNKTDPNTNQPQTHTKRLLRHAWKAKRGVSF